jgi:hypothetical protein
VPNYGGANTTFYILFEIMQKAGWNIHYLNIVEQERLNFYRRAFGNSLGNPRGLPNVHNILFKNGHSSSLIDLIDAVQPELIIGKNFIAPHLLKKQRPDIETWFLPSICSQIRNGIYKGILRSEIEALHKVNSYKNSIPMTWEPEIQAVESSDRIICHTKSTRFWFNHFYRDHKHKISEKILWSAPLVNKKLTKHKSGLKEFENREIDILFVANRWSRAEKNYELAKQIIKSCNGLNIHIVGECKDEIERAVYHQFLIPEEVMNLMNNTKTVVSTSSYDPAPNVLFEASIMGCNIIASKNCGNWELCPPELLVDPYCLENYVDKIHLSLTGKFKSNLEYFLKDDPASQIARLVKQSCTINSN